MMESKESRLHTVLEDAIPAALSNLYEKHEQLTDIIQSLEGNYLAVENDLKRRKELEQQARTYLVDSLSTISKHIDILAGNLSQAVTVQSSAVESLSSQVELAKRYDNLYGNFLI